MKAQKFAAGAVFVGVVTAGMFSAAPAFADAGISVAGGGNQVGLGDQKQGSGAYAEAGKNQLSLALSTGMNLNPKSPGATAIANGTNDNTAVAIDGVTIVSGEHNHGFTALGESSVNGKSNNMVTVGGGGFTAPDTHDNFVVNAGGAVLAGGQGTAPGVVNLSVCGTEFSGQADHIKVGSIPGGLCG